MTVDIMIHVRETVLRGTHSWNSGQHSAACDASIHGKKYSNSKRFPVPTLSVYHASEIAYLAQYDIYFKKWPIDERLHCEIIAVSKVLYLFRWNTLT